MDVKDSILQFISTNNIKDLKSFLLSLTACDKMNAINFIIEMGQKSRQGEFDKCKNPYYKNFNEYSTEVCKMYLEEKALNLKFEDFLFENKIEENNKKTTLQQQKQFLTVLYNNSESYNIKTLDEIFEDFNMFEKKYLSD